MFIFKRTGLESKLHDETQSERQTGVKWRTRADEHDIILPVLCLHSVHHQLGELVVHIRPHHDGTSPYRVHRVVHGRVTPGERDDIIGKVLGGVEASEGLAGTLRTAP